MEVRITCQDNTRILSEEEEINSLLQGGWIIIETGIASFCTSVDLSQHTFAFRLREIEDSRVYNLKWEDLKPRRSIPMIFSEVQPFESSIEKIKTTDDFRLVEKHIEEGWRLLKKIKIHSKCNFYKYILVI